MIQYAIRALLKALGPLIGAEEETGRTVASGWAESVDKDKLDSWKAKAESLEDELDEVVQNGTVNEYLALMRKRLGLLTSEKADEADIIDKLLTMMQNQSLDFHITFRTLCFFSPSAFLVEEDKEDRSYQKKVLENLVPAPTSSSSKTGLQDSEALLDLGRKEVKTWLDNYAHRIMNEKEAWVQKLSGKEENPNDDMWEKERRDSMLRFNPRFVLRQWVLEEVIKKVEQDPYKGKRILAKVMEMTTKPFEPWGAEFTENDNEVKDPEVKEERRYCGIGSKEMLGFQCSCSS